ncbi:porin [Comamonadaceae bacterium OH2545_COT-014]|nr:porin [Comamonadaceae bacterium OH2545_COT-014]
MISSTFGNHSNSYIGLRGVEDMGGGLKAGFNFEQIINMENGTVGVAADSPTWQRAANVWLGGNWGRFQMGRATTPSYNAMLAWDLMGLPNYAPATFSLGFVGGNTGDRNYSLFSYKTPVWGGFSAELGYIAKGDDVSGNASQNDKFDLGVTYVNGPLSAGAAYNKVKSYKANYGLGAKYNFGSFTLAASYQDSNNWSIPGAPGAVGRVAGVTLGGMVNFGAMSVALDVVRQLKREATFQNVVYKDKKYTDGALELKYALSKRTFFYGAYFRVEGTNNYSLGMQHRF